MRIFTCTPVAFGHSPEFFSRDSGLLCRGLQMIGVESMAVMPGKPGPEDPADLVQTGYANLESAEWWQARHLDGVVLYAWGRPKFRRVAAAIRKAGIFLILNLDSGGPVSPRAGWRDWLHAQWIYGGQGRGFVSWLRAGRLILRGITVGLLCTDPLRARHLRCGDVIGAVSPGAAGYWRALCRSYGRAGMADKVALLPHAVERRFIHPDPEKIAGSLAAPSDKSRQIVCVGRWHDEVQKRAWLMMDVIPRLLETDREVTVVIVGAVTAAMREWHRGLAGDMAARVRLAGRVDRGELAAICRQSQVFYSPSAYESFGIAAAEALCCGCSVVAARKPTLPSFEWFVSENSGRLALRDDAAGHLEALRHELAAWEHAERDPVEIPRVWCARLHADRVAARVLEMASHAKARPAAPPSTHASDGTRPN